MTLTYDLDTARKERNDLTLEAMTDGLKSHSNTLASELRRAARDLTRAAEALEDATSAPDHLVAPMVATASLSASLGLQNHANNAGRSAATLNGKASALQALELGGDA